MRRRQAPAPSSQAVSITRMSRPRNPTMVVVTIGKNAITEQRTATGMVPYPIHSTSKGATATSGTVWEKAMKGSAMAASSREWAIIYPSGRAMTMDRAEPRSAATRVGST